MHQAFILSSDLHKWLFLFLSCFWPLHNVPAFKQIILCLYFLLFLTLVCNCNRIFPIVTFHSLWNRQKTKRFLMVSRGIIWKHWFEIILITWWITFVYCWFYICFRPGFWGTFFCFIWERIDYRIVQVFLLSPTRLSFILLHSLKIVPLSLMFPVPSFHSKE